MIRPHLIYLLLTAFAITGKPALAATESLEFGYVELPPFVSADNDGQPRGYLARLTRRVISDMDLPVHYQHYPPARLYRQIRSGETALTLGAAGLESLQGATVESSESAITLTIAIYHRQDTKPIHQVNGLVGQRIVLMQGYSYGRLGRFLSANADSMDISYARSHLSGLEMLRYERADYLLNYQIPADTVIAKNGLGGLKRQVIRNVPIHLFVSRKVEEAQSVAESWDRHLRKIKEKGTLPVFNYYTDFE